MSRSGADTLLDRWENDAAFRDSMRRDPEGAVKASGVTLSGAELAALKSVDWSQSDEALAARASKMA